VIYLHDLYCGDIKIQFDMNGMSQQKEDATRALALALVEKRREVAANGKRKNLNRHEYSSLNEGVKILFGLQESPKRQTVYGIAKKIESGEWKCVRHADPLPGTMAGSGTQYIAEGGCRTECVDRCREIIARNVSEYYNSFTPEVYALVSHMPRNCRKGYEYLSFNYLVRSCERDMGYSVERGGRWDVHDKSFEENFLPGGEYENYCTNSGFTVAQIREMWDMVKERVDGRRPHPPNRNHVRGQFSYKGQEVSSCGDPGERWYAFLCKQLETERDDGRVTLAANDVDFQGRPWETVRNYKERFEDFTPDNKELIAHQAMECTAHKGSGRTSEVDPCSEEGTWDERAKSLVDLMNTPDDIMELTARLPLGKWIRLLAI
jgi:hypothetical protein